MTVIAALGSMEVNDQGGTDEGRVCAVGDLDGNRNDGLEDRVLIIFLGAFPFLLYSDLPRPRNLCVLTDVL